MMIAWYPFGIDECSGGWMKKILITIEEWMVLAMKTLDGAPKLCRLAVDRGMLVQPTRGLTNFAAFAAGEEQ